MQISKMCVIAVGAEEVDAIQDWLFRVNCLGPFATDEDIAQVIGDTPDPDHPEVAYLQAILDARFIATALGAADDAKAAA